MVGFWRGWEDCERWEEGRDLERRERVVVGFFHLTYHYVNFKLIVCSPHLVQQKKTPESLPEPPSPWRDATLLALSSTSSTSTLPSLPTTSTSLAFFPFSSTMRRSSTIGINGGTSSSGGSGLHRTPSTGSGEIQNRRITMDALAGLRAVSNSDDPVAQLVEKERECDKVSSPTF